MASSIASMSNTHPTFNSFQPSSRMWIIAPSMLVPIFVNCACAAHASALEPSPSTRTWLAQLAASHCAASTSPKLLPHSWHSLQTVLSEIGTAPICSSTWAALSKSSNPPSHTACLITHSLQCSSHNRNCSSRGKKPLATVGAMVVTTLYFDSAYPAFYRVRLVPLVTHLPPACGA